MVPVYKSFYPHRRLQVTQSPAFLTDYKKSKGVEGCAGDFLGKSACLHYQTDKLAV